MKILKIIVSGLPLFKNKCEIDFLALQRVSENNSEKMSKVFTNSTQSFYQNNVISIVGINASGKTTLLRLITFVCCLLNNEPINRVADCIEIFDGLSGSEKVSFDTYFYAENKSVNLLHTVVAKENDRLLIEQETLKSKPISRIKNKKALFDFADCKDCLSRNTNAEFLLDDVSIMVAFNKRNNEKVTMTEMLQYTNINQLSITENCPLELIAFFDPNIEYLNFRKVGSETDICLKFKDKEEIILNQVSELNRYLSSGTIKGINTFQNAMKTFSTGGYMIIDELENHFNREIVSTLVRFYMDKKVNPKGATLIFSTHYSELLDEFERNDNIYIVRNREGITAENLSTLLKRNDIKKSEVFQSGFLEGTVPMYDAYMDLKKVLINNCKEDL